MGLNKSLEEEDIKKKDTRKTRTEISTIDTYLRGSTQTTHHTKTTTLTTNSSLPTNTSNMGPRRSDHRTATNTIDTTIYDDTLEQTLKTYDTHIHDIKKFQKQNIIIKSRK